jgi:lipopolysaccharide transport system permease protein
MHNTKNAPVVVYTSSSQAGSLPKLIGSMAKDLIASRELSWRLFIRDISAQYRQSLFGILWAFIPPIITSLIFIVLQSRNVLNFGETDIPYPAYVFVGTLLWQIFADSLNAPLKAAVAAQALLAKINFPREALIVSSFYMVVFNALIKGIVLVVVILLFRLQPAWGIVFAPVMILFLIFLGISLGTLITPIGLLYTDVATSLPILIQLAFFVTPVVYEPPTSFPLSLIAVLNPVSPLLIAARDLLTIGTIDNFIAPLIVSILTILLVLVSWIFYRLAIPIIIERMSA